MTRHLVSWYRALSACSLLFGAACGSEPDEKHELTSDSLGCPPSATVSASPQTVLVAGIGVEVRLPRGYRRKVWEKPDPSRGVVEWWYENTPRRTVYLIVVSDTKTFTKPSDTVGLVSPVRCRIASGSGTANVLIHRTAGQYAGQVSLPFFTYIEWPVGNGGRMLRLNATATDSSGLAEQLGIARSLRITGVDTTSAAKP